MSNTVATALRMAGRNGRWVLSAGLVAGLCLPALSEGSRALIPLCIALLLWVSCLRLGPGEPGLRRPDRSLLLRVLAAQLALPVLLAGLFFALSVPTTWALPALLVTCAAPITGGPNLVLLSGGNGALALRILVLGTALLPLSCLPALWLMQLALSPAELMATSIRLLLLIACAWLGAAWLRRQPWFSDARPTHEALDGLASLLLAVMVVGLMAGVHNAWQEPERIGLTLAWAIGLNVGLQWLGTWMARRGPAVDAIASGVMNGNRNIALFLGALPTSALDELLLFVACYQIPMYLTPLLGRHLYARVLADKPGLMRGS